MAFDFETHVSQVLRLTQLCLLRQPRSQILIDFCVLCAPAVNQSIRIPDLRASIGIEFNLSIDADFLLQFFHVTDNADHAIFVTECFECLEYHTE